MRTPACSGCWAATRSEVLAARLAGRGDISAMYRLLAPLNLLGVPGAADATGDLDTPADLAARLGRLP